MVQIANSTVGCPEIKKILNLNRNEGTSMDEITSFEESFNLVSTIRHETEFEIARKFFSQLHYVL